MSSLPVIASPVTASRSWASLGLCAHAGAAPSKDVINALAEVAKADPDAGARAAAVGALGRANLSAAERVAILRDLRIDAGAAAPASGAKPEGGA